MLLKYTAVRIEMLGLSCVPMQLVVVGSRSCGTGRPAPSPRVGAMLKRHRAGASSDFPVVAAHLRTLQAAGLAAPTSEYALAGSAWGDPLVWNRIDQPADYPTS